VPRRHCHTQDHIAAAALAKLTEPKVARCTASRSLAANISIENGELNDAVTAIASIGEGGVKG
jgi:hypothetical protein